MHTFESSDSAIDVVIVPSHYALGEMIPSRPLIYFEASHEIVRDIWLGPIESSLELSVLDACDRRGENFKPYRQYSGAYGFLRRNSPNPDQLRFDPDGRLYACIALSRLVHPTSTGLEYAARIRSFGSDERMIIPGAPITLNPYAFVSDESSDWLIPDDVPILRRLMSAYDRQDAPDRVRAALWYHESAFRDYFVSKRWAIVVTGLEALFHIRDEKCPFNSRRAAGSTRVFAQRASQIAARLGLGAIDEHLLRESYSARSEIVHGAAIGDLDTTTQSLYRQTETLLSMCIQQALLDPVFANCFESDAAIQSAFPLS